MTTTANSAYRSGVSSSYLRPPAPPFLKPPQESASGNIMINKQAAAAAAAAHAEMALVQYTARTKLEDLGRELMMDEDEEMQVEEMEDDTGQGKEKEPVSLYKDQSAAAGEDEESPKVAREALAVVRTMLARLRDLAQRIQPPPSALAEQMEEERMGREECKTDEEDTIDQQRRRLGLGSPFFRSSEEDEEATTAAQQAAAKTEASTSSNNLTPRSLLVVAKGAVHALRMAEKARDLGFRTDVTRSALQVGM